MEIGSQNTLRHFRYEPLRDGSIRLLSFMGMGMDGRPVCNLFDSALDEHAQFYALSYVWGSDTRNQFINCNGKELPVTESVFGALTGLKSRIMDGKLPIWIDALCINQADDEEKAREVANMHRIYRRAKATVIWLGPEADDSDLAMDGVEKLAKLLPSLSVVPHPDRLLEYGLPAKDDPIWPALGCLFSRPWSFRLWTFQEVILAETAIVCCGSATVDWPKFEVVGYSIHEQRLWPITISEKTKQSQFRGFMSAANISLLKRNFGSLTVHEPDEEPYFRFSRLLPLAQSKQCSEPRDRVYAMLSLTSQSFRDTVDVNYHIPLTELYIQCGKACLKQDPKLFYLQLTTAQKRRPDLPSWCLDLQPQEMEMIFDDYLRAGLREASADSNRANIKIIQGSNDIEIQGFRADTVDQVVPMNFVWPHKRTVDNAKDIVEWEAKCRSLACNSLRLPPNEVPIAHVCTLSAHIRARQADFDALTQGYRDQMTNINSQAEGKGDCPPPPERQPPYDYFWLQMTRTCPGRTYFSTANGRVGIGPPDIQRGDLVVVIYGTEPVFILRELPTPDTRLEIIGDAFVHGLMDLNETPEEVIRPTEWFVIC